jgi:WD40 repeat protein
MENTLSQAHDKTIRVWDTETGEVVSGPFEGHIKPVTSVAFSSDSRCTVSGSWDNTIHSWDEKAEGLVFGPFEGHIHVVSSVVFFPDGNYIVLGSWDNMIHIWYVGMDQAITKPVEGHSGKTRNIQNFQIKDNCTTHMISCFEDSSKLIDGWILGSNSELLFWVSPSFCDGL